MTAAILAALLAAPVSAQNAGWTRLQGPQSHVAQPRVVVVADARAWSELWREHAGASSQPPAVDFARERVVAVFLGERPTTGYEVTLQAAPDPDAPRGVVVTYGESRPRGFAAEIVTSPFAFLKVAAKRVTIEAAPGCRILMEGAERRARFGATAGAQAAMKSLQFLRAAPGALFVGR